MTKETAISICEALYHHLQPYDEQPKEAFRMAVDALEGQLEQSQGIVRCKDCKYRGNNKKCIIAFVADKQDFPFFFYDNHGEWYCADGERKSD